MKANKIVELSDREHVLQRESMYIGSVKYISHDSVFLENEKFVYKDYESVDGLLKIINEIIDNAVDEGIRTDFKYSTLIKVTMSKDSVKVQDNGRGIPVEKVTTKDGGQEYAPTLAFTRPKAGSNFEDEGRTTMGLNGVGSFACNVFSRIFNVITNDGKKRFTLKCKDNLESFATSISKSQGVDHKGTTVTFKPDLSRFEVDELDELHQKLIEQRLIHLAATYPKIQFKFNKKSIKVKNGKQYLSSFSDHCVFVEEENYIIGFAPNEEDDFKQVSFVNGLDIKKGGNHIDYILSEVGSRLKDKISKKYKSIKPGDVKNRLQAIVLFRNFPQVLFDGQTKESLTNSAESIKEFLKEVDWDKFTNKIYKNKEILEPIIESFKIKEELKKARDLKKLNKNLSKKKIKCEKYLPAIENKKYLVLVEGECLEENTEVLMADYNTKKLKDIDIGEKVISGDLSIQTVQGKTKLLKETLTFYTKSGKIICGYKHKLKVYDIETCNFIFLEAIKIKEDIERYKFVKSKINADARLILIISNDMEKKTLILDDGYISYTDDDNFVIIRDNDIIRINSKEIMKNDSLLLSK